MKKFLSKVLTLALVCAIVVTGTSITSEAKGKKSSKKAVATTYSSNAVINDFVATAIKSNGLVIGGKSYDSQQALTLAFAANPAVTVSPMYDYDDNTPSGRRSNFNLYSDGLTGRRNYDAVGIATIIYYSAIFEQDLNDMKAFGFTHFGEDARLNTNGVWHTDAFIANGVNTQYICSWMQSRGLNTASDVYNYLVANGATFTVNTGIIYGGDGTDPEQHFVCVQCPNLYYDINTTNGDSSISYDDPDLYGVSSGVNRFSISSGTGGEVSGPVGSQTSVSYPVTDFSSYLSH